jgi:hypothetical protein
MEIDWVNLLLAILTSGVVSSLVVLALRTGIKTKIESAIKSQYDEKLERLRNELKRETELELAKARGEIQAEVDYRATKVKYIYERKLKALCETYSKLATLEKLLGEYVTYWGETRGEERESARKAFVKGIKEFEDYFVPNRIFFPEDLAEKITTLKNNYHKVAMEFMVHVENPNNSFGPSKNSTEKWQAANEYVTEESPKVRREIERALRQEFGDEKPQGN